MKKYQKRKLKSGLKIDMIRAMATVTKMIIINDNVDPQTEVSGGWAGQEGETKIQIQWEILIENENDHFFYWKYENSDHNYDGDDHNDDSY